jgi:hypothetical protein
MQEVGFEPTRIAPLRPQRSAVTTWLLLLEIGYTEPPTILRRMGFEPMRIAPLVPETSALTTWLSTLIGFAAYLWDFTYQLTKLLMQRQQPFQS